MDENGKNVERHMMGADEIAKTFGVSRETVALWARKGAPIRKIGRKYQARYHELWGWVLKFYSA